MIIHPIEPVTERQLEFIESLCEKIGWNRQDCFAWLCKAYNQPASVFLRWEQVSKWQASKLIDYLKEKQ